MSKISIIVPVYKTEKYLERCVSSILNQTYRDLEVILVDDGSPDNCPKMCDAFAEADARVRVIHKKNGGVSTARNDGLDVANGEYITFVDSDDWIEPDMYAAMMGKVQENDCDIVMCDCLKEYGNRSELYTHEIRSGYYDSEQLRTEYYPHLLIMENVEYPATISNWLLLFRRELAEDVRYLEGVRYSEDLLFGAQLMVRANTFCYMKGQALYHYRMNPDSATHRFVPNKWDDYMKLHRAIRDVFFANECYDFSRQIDLCLLFFLYNAVGDIYGAARLNRRDKKRRITTILNAEEVQSLFARINISDLQIAVKQKIITSLYKHRMGISLLILYYGR